MTLENGYHTVGPGKVATIVTQLEMRSRPALRGATCPVGLSFAELPRDITVYREIFTRVGREWLWFGRLLLNDEDLAAILNDPKVHLYTLLKNGRPEALLELDFREDGACELAYFGLTNTLIGSGAGAYLMDRAIDLAWSHPIARFHVYTCTLDSPQALSFYERTGFTAINRKVEVADDPRILGIHPKTAGSHVPML